MASVRPATIAEYIQLQIAYKESLPEDLIRKIAEYRLRTVRERQDDAFWYRGLANRA